MRVGYSWSASGEQVLRDFVAGVIDPARFYSIMRSRPLSYTVGIAAGLVRHPSLLRKVYSNCRRVSDEAATDRDATGCELTSIGVAPEIQGRGLGRALVRQFLVRAWARGAHSVYLTTDTDDNATANALYIKSGFQLWRAFSRSDQRRLNEYVIMRESTDVR